MSTRCNIEIYDSSKTTPKWRQNLGAILYHHADGYPEFMLPKLRRFLTAAKGMVLSHGWWDSERVAAAMIFLSSQDYEKPLRPNKISRPYFQPCLKLHGDIDYIYRVFLNKNGGFDIETVRH